MADGDRVRTTGALAEGESVGDVSPVLIGAEDPAGKAAGAKANAKGELRVDLDASRRLAECLSVQGRDTGFLALQTRGRERITLTDRRGSDGQRGR